MVAIVSDSLMIICRQKLVTGLFLWWVLSMKKPCILSLSVGSADITVELKYQIWFNFLLFMYVFTCVQCMLLSAILRLA